MPARINFVPRFLPDTPMPQLRQFVAPFAVMTVFFCHVTSAQVYQCADAAGKKTFSQTPCAAAGGSEKQLMRAPTLPAAQPALEPGESRPFRGEPGVLYGNSGGTPPPKDWAAENAAANARAAAADRNAAARSNAPATLGRLQPKAGTPHATDEQIVSQCEANRGARCTTQGEIAQRRMEQRELSPAERQQQQNAVAARRERQREEEFNRMIRR